jgi:hypothetical protein
MGVGKICHLPCVPDHPDYCKRLAIAGQQPIIYYSQALDDTAAKRVSGTSQSEIV